MPLRFAPGQGSLRSPWYCFLRFCLTDTHFCFRRKPKGFSRRAVFASLVPRSVAMRSIAERRGTQITLSKLPNTITALGGDI